MSYQRFAFERQSPERQKELIEKQTKQQQLREMLRQQIEEKQREKAAEQQQVPVFRREPPSEYRSPPEYRAPPPEYRAPPPEYRAPPPEYRAPPPMDYRAPEAMPRDYYPMPTAQVGDFGSFVPSPVMIAPPRPLLSDRKRVTQMGRTQMSMTLKPAKIHDTFSNLRCSMMSSSVRNSTFM